MVVESIVSPKYARRNPYFLFFLGMIYSSLGIIFSLIIFPSNASITSVFLTTIGCIPLFFSLLRSEEKFEIRFLEDTFFLAREHIHVLGVFFFLFMGFTISYSLWFSFLPDWAMDSVFNDQLLTLVNISNITGGFFSDALFNIILRNNLRVLFFCFFFSFVYGTGAIFILSWNASVLGAAVGSFIRKELEKVASSTHLMNLAIYFQHLPVSLGSYMVHGVFEILAYFIACFAGSIISFVFITEDYKNTSKFFKVLKNTIILLATAVLLLVFAAFLETGV